LVGLKLLGEKEDGEVQRGSGADNPTGGAGTEAFSLKGRTGEISSEPCDNEPSGRKKVLGYQKILRENDLAKASVY